MTARVMISLFHETYLPHKRCKMTEREFFIIIINISKSKLNNTRNNESFRRSACLREANKAHSDTTKVWNLWARLIWWFLITLVGVSHNPLSSFVVPLLELCYSFKWSLFKISAILILCIHFIVQLKDTLKPAEASTKISGRNYHLFCSVKCISWYLIVYQIYPTFSYKKKIFCFPLKFKKYKSHVCSKK